ncbi:MAG: cobalt-precorrin 5A hydrolase [Bacillota bacterium]|nr:cobalt-precorrin 5A hydrolase [Bacillota bacterium]
MIKALPICIEMEKNKVESKTAVICFTKQGELLAEKINKFMAADIYSKNSVSNFKLNEITSSLMNNYKALIFIGSTGIAVRAIAPNLKGKDKDPAVIVIDNSCKYVISLISGHIGGANKLTLAVAEYLGAEPIITTATDNLRIEAPDVIAVDNNLVIDDLKKAKDIAAMLVNGEKVVFLDEEEKILMPAGYVNDFSEANGVVYITNKNKLPQDYSNKKVLKLIRKNIVLGVGCRKNYDEELMFTNVKGVLEQFNLDIRSVLEISTVEVKKEEKAIIKLTETLNVQLRIHGLEAIKQIQHKYPGSDFVEKSVGVRAVCEPCTELSGAKLISDKISCNGMTICIGIK